MSGQEQIRESDAFRFWVGTPDERHSTVWKIWENGNQVYALTTSLGGISKLSLHSPDSCQFGFEKAYRELRGYGKSLAGFPTFIRWKRRKATDAQIVPLAHLYFPSDFLKSKNATPEKRGEKFQCGLLSAPSGECVEVFIAAMPRPSIPEDLTSRGPYMLLCWMPLGEDELCVVLARNRVFSPEGLPIGRPIEFPDEWMNEAARNLRSGESLEDQSLLSWSHPNDFEPIHIVEMTGMKLTKNYSREVPRET